MSEAQRELRKAIYSLPQTNDEQSNSQSIDVGLCGNQKTDARVLFADLTISPFLCCLSPLLPFFCISLSFLSLSFSSLSSLPRLSSHSPSRPLCSPPTLYLFPSLALSLFSLLFPWRLRRHTHIGRCVGWGGTGRDRVGWIHNFRSDAVDGDRTVVAHVQVGQRTALSKGEEREGDRERGWKQGESAIESERER